MDKISFLANEILLNIGTFLHHPPDILHFAQTCRQFHNLIIPLLYKNIKLDTSVYLDRSERGYHRQEDNPLAAAMNLLGCKLIKTPELRPAIHSLDTGMDVNFLESSSAFPALLACLPALVKLEVNVSAASSFHPKTVKACPHPMIKNSVAVACYCRESNGHFAPYRLGQALMSIQSNLKSLTICTDLEMAYCSRGVYCSRRGIGNLQHLAVLEYLDIQGSIFLGQMLPTTISDRDLTKRLPPSLRELHVRNYWKDEADHWLRHRLLKDRFQDRQPLRQGAMCKLLFETFLELDPLPP